MTRDRKKQRTREALEEAALRLFEEKGFRNTSVNEIADVAQVSPRTFFRYFGTKDELLFSHHSRHLDDLMAAVRRSWDRTPALSSLDRAIVAFAEELDERGDTIFPHARLIAETPTLLSRSLHLRHSWEETLAAELASLAGRPGPDMRLRVLSCMVVTALHVSAHAWRESGSAGSQAAVVRKALEALRAAVGDQPGEAPAGPGEA